MFYFVDVIRALPDSRMAERDPHWITAYADPAGAERDELYETAVFELVGRYPAALKGACTVGFKIPLLAPQLRPFSWRTLAWTYVIPALPWVIFWDALVSCLRVYSQAELAELTRSLRDSGYRWHIGTVHLGSSQQQALYLWGAPEELLQDGEPA